MKTLVLCNLFKGLVLDLPSHSRGNFATWEKDEEKNDNRLIRNLFQARSPLSERLEQAILFVLFGAGISNGKLPVRM